MAQKTPVDRSVNRGLPRRQADSKMLLQFPSDLTLRDAIEVHVMQKGLHSTIDLGV